MSWTHDLAYFLGGLFFINTIPHFVSGVMGRSFQSPFAKPPGRGRSTATVNIVWGFANLVVAYLLLCRVGGFELRAWDNVGAVGAGVLLMGLFAARRFGKFNGGDTAVDG